ncbi:MAG: hypothetical protein GY795_28780 [Desulfobacterales bacterium]|nr:hypothetical protein [Desulfobacterales bacterium]
MAKIEWIHPKDAGVEYHKLPLDFCGSNDMWCFSTWDEANKYVQKRHEEIFEKIKKN